MVDGPRHVEALLPEVYEELRALAAHLRRRHGAGDSARSTSLVHEAFERLVRSGATVDSRAHLLALAARAMRNVLVDRARAAATDKRGGGWARITLEHVGAGAGDVDVLAVDQALNDLALEDARAAEIVHLRFFGGMELAEIAELLQVSERTVDRDWRAAKAWLSERLGG